LSGAPIVINGRVTNGWQFAFWRNRVLLALIAALLTLAIILTFTPGLSGIESSTGNPPVSEVSR
jgi:hypothetical protein